MQARPLVHNVHIVTEKFLPEATAKGDVFTQPVMISTGKNRGVKRPPAHLCSAVAFDQIWVHHPRHHQAKDGLRAVYGMATSKWDASLSADVNTTIQYLLQVHVSTAPILGLSATAHILVAAELNPVGLGSDFTAAPNKPKMLSRCIYQQARTLSMQARTKQWTLSTAEGVMCMYE